MINNLSSDNQKILIISIISVVFIAAIALFFLFGKPLVGFAGYNNYTANSAGVLIYSSEGDLEWAPLTLEEQKAYGVEVVANLGNQNGKVFRYTLNYNPDQIGFYPFFGTSYFELRDEFTIISQTIPLDETGQINITAVVNPPYNLNDFKEPGKAYVVLGRSTLLTKDGSASDNIMFSVSDLSILDEDGDEINLELVNPDLAVKCDFGSVLGDGVCHEITCGSKEFINCINVSSYMGCGLLGYGEFEWDCPNGYTCQPNNGCVLVDTVGSCTTSGDLVTLDEELIGTINDFDVFALQYVVQAINTMGGCGDVGGATCPFPDDGIYVCKNGKSYLQAGTC